MKLIADYHVHSKYSKFGHGKNTIEELARTANSMGLKEIAITDHGFKHLCGTSRANIKKARKIIDEINEWSSTKILLGVEADIISEDGTIDVDNETLTYLDILVVGYHKLIKTDFASFFGTSKGKQKATNAYINAINKYPITIISHLDSILTTDLYEIGRACREKGVMIEINERHTKWTQDQIDELIASDCLFVVNSDAHRREDIGEVEKCFELIKKYEIPSENIANVEFSYDEKTDKDIEVEAFMGFYERQMEEKKKQEKLSNKKEIVHTESLSKEMEEALQNIAKEQGIKYKVVKENDSVGNYISELEEMIKSQDYQEFINQNKLVEFDNQNEIIENQDTFFENESITQDEQDGYIEIELELGEENTIEEPNLNSVNMAQPKITAETQQPLNNQETLVDKKEDVSDILNLSIQTSKVAQNNTKSTKSSSRVVIEKNEKPAQSKNTKTRGGFVGMGGVTGKSDKK